jgi:hypothetical protein
MLKTKCFIIGGMILSSSLQAEVSEPVKKTGDVPEEPISAEEESSALEKLVDKYFPPKPVKETGNEPAKPVSTEEDRNRAEEKFEEPVFTEEDRRIEEELERAGRFELIKKMGNDPAKLARTKKGIIEEEKERRARERLMARIELDEQLFEIKEKYELKRKVEMHEEEIQQLKNKLREIEYDLDEIRKEQILNRPSLRQQLEL